MWKLNNIYLNCQWVKEEIKEVAWIAIWKPNTARHMDYSQSSSKKKVHSGKRLHSEKRRSQISNPTLYLQEVEKEQTDPKVSRGEEIIIIRAEWNEIEIYKNNRKYQWNWVVLLKRYTNWQTFNWNENNKKPEQTQMNKIVDERGNIITDITEIQDYKRLL